MKSLSVLLFSAKELEALVSDPISRVRAEKRVRHIAILPVCLGDLKSAINGILDSYQNKFDENFNGFILGYKNVKILTDRGTIINDACYVHLDIEADFYIFTPEVGCTLFGIVNKKSADHIGCLVHKRYHVSLPQSPEEIEEEWLGSSVKIGDGVMFTVEVCDFTGNLPYIRGKLIDSTPGNVTPLMAEEVDSTSEPKKKKNKKRHKESEESLGGAEYNLMTDSLQQEVTEPQQKKRKRHLEDEWEAGTEKKKKKKVEDHKSDYHETPENEDLHFTHLSSKGIEYNTILEDLEVKYLNKTQGDSDSKSRKKKKKESKLHIDANENKETASTEDLEYAHEINATHFPDHTHKVKKSHKKKEKQNEMMTEEVPELGLRKSSCKQLEESLISASSHDNSYISSASSAFRSSMAALLGTSIQETDFDMTDVSPKAKKKKTKKHDPLQVKSKDEATISLNEHYKSPVKEKCLVGAEKLARGHNLNSQQSNLESNFEMKDISPKAKKKKTKKHDPLQVKSKDETPISLNEHYKSPAKEECLVGNEKPAREHNLNSQRPNLESNFEMKDVSPKAKKKKNKKHDPLQVKSKDEATISLNEHYKSSAKEECLVGAEKLAREHNLKSQRPNLESNFEMKYISPKAKKRKTKKHDHLHVQSKAETSISLNEHYKSTAKEECLVAAEKPAKELTNFDMKHGSPKTKRKKLKHKDVEPLDVQRKAETAMSLQKSSVKSVPMNNLANNSDDKDLYRKERYDGFESHNRELLDFHNESYKSTAKEESSSKGEQRLDSLPQNMDSGELNLVPSIEELLNRAKSELNVKSSKKHKKNKERKKKHSETLHAPKISSKFAKR